MTELEETVEPSVEETMEAVYDKINTQEENLQPDAPEEASDEVVEEPTETEGEDTPQESVEPPASWTAEAKEQFSQLPVETQQYIAEREAQREKAINETKAELAEVRKATSGYEGVTQKYGQYLESIGMEPDQAFETLLAAEYTLRNGSPQEKMQLFAQLAQDYGVSLDGDPDSQVAQLSRELNNVKSTLSNLTESQQKEIERENLKTIEAFKGAKGEDGELSHPHFEEVRETMSKLLSSELAGDLEEAYGKAVLLVPEVKAKIEAENQKKQQKIAADKAKKAKSEASVKSRGVPNDMVAKSESFEETMERVYDQISSA